jgi:hypothetical protein
MEKHSHKRLFVGIALVMMILSALACQFISPTPAAWVSTTTAQALISTNAVILRTREALDAIGNEIIPTTTPVIPQRSPTPQITDPADGPWLVYPAPDGKSIHAFDVDAKQILTVNLPSPIYLTDLTRGLSPDGKKLILRAGSPENVDELALYQIDLPSTEITKITPLLSLSLQRKIVNQEGERAFEVLEAVTRTDGLAWSPNGRFLAFTAALDNDSSDLYVLDTLNNRIERINGLYSQNASPFWSTSSNWLISQELDQLDDQNNWRSVNVSGVQVPGYDDQNTLYLPPTESIGEVFLGWLNPQSFISYSQTVNGALTLQQVSVDTQETTIIFEGLFDQAVFDESSKTLAFTIGNNQAAELGMVAGVYRLQAEDTFYILLRAGDWGALFQEPAGRFVAKGPQGLFVFDADGESVLFAEEGDLRFSPNGTWVVAWGDGVTSKSGLRLYQTGSGNPLQTITLEPVQSAFWLPNSKGFFMQAGGGLYQLSFPTLNPELIENGFPLEEAIEWLWME